MPKKILLIENESAFAAGISESLEASGFDMRVTGEGKEGLELAREWAPDAIVLCVELPGMSGYLVCQKLKKDDMLKAIPLVLTSAEATLETFEKHRTLKARADEYLLKPYAPAALVDKLAALVGLPEPEPAGETTGEHEELVSLEEEMGLEALPSEPDADLPALDLQSLPDEPVAAGGSALPGDEDLSLLDEAFEGLAAGTDPSRSKSAGEALDLELAREVPVAIDEVDAAAASLPVEDESPARADLGLGLELDDADAALGALGEDEPLPPEPEIEIEPPRAAAVRGASADALRAAGIALLDDAPAPRRTVIAPPPPLRGDGAPASRATITRLERELADAQEALADANGAASSREAELRSLRSRGEEAEAELAGRDDELATLRARLDALAAQVKKGDADAKTARDEARGATERAVAAERRVDEAEVRAREGEQRADAALAKLADAERRADEAAASADDAREEARRKADEAALAVDAAAKVEALERELEELRTELVVARGEAEGSRGEVEKHTAELEKRVQELEAANAKHEERVLKAYQKIKNDEKVKDKVRKAIAIAAQLLEEGLPPETQVDKERRAAAATLLGRDS